jgi:hypothetical protein
MRSRGDVHFVGPASEGRDVGDQPAVIDQNATARFQLVGDQLALQAFTGAPRQFARRLGRDEWIGVNLPVRVMQRDPNLLAAVLEDVDVLDPPARGEVTIPIGPDLGQ